MNVQWVLSILILLSLFWPAALWLLFGFWCLLLILVAGEFFLTWLSYMIGWED